MALLCGAHHDEIHREHWTITMRNGVPWLTPPRWIDPDQAPRRNTLHTATTHVRRLGHHLLNTHPPGHPPDATAA